MKVTLDRPIQGTCTVTGRTGVEVWPVETGDGGVQFVGSKSLLGSLKLLTSVAEPTPAITSVTNGTTASKAS